VFTTVLGKAFGDLDAILRELLSEERKMHESLQKFKKPGDEAQITGDLSDFDKMRVQLLVDLGALKGQISGLDQQNQ